MMTLPAVESVLAFAQPLEPVTAIERKKRSLADMAGVEVTALPPPEFDDTVYRKEVLQLESGQTEESLDNFYHREAVDLGIDVSQDTIDDLTGDPSNSASTGTVTSANVRSRTTSRASQSTGITAPSSRAHRTSLNKPSPARGQNPTLRRSLSFTEYEKFLSQAQVRDFMSCPSTPVITIIPPLQTSNSSQSIFSVSTKKSYFSIKRGIGRMGKFGKSKSSLVAEEVKSCIRCRDDFSKNKALHNLPCSHIYCDACLRGLVTMAMQQEAKMPPKCCQKPVPAFIVKSVLNETQQQIFMKRVLQFATPDEERIFCPKSACREFIPKPVTVNPKHPFQVECKRCHVKVCKQCKKVAHSAGRDCPGDWELEAVSKMDKDTRWKRCYQCEGMVQQPKGQSHMMTCSCDAHFCYVCGAIWDDQIGCPNDCNGEEEARRKKVEAKERRDIELRERAKQAALEYSTSAEAMAAVKRSRENQELTKLRIRQVNERDRFLNFEQKQKWALWTRHGQEKVQMLDRHVELERKMRERHHRTHTTLEDRQVAAEMELRQTLKQERKACAIRLRHMEAYCDGLNSGNGNVPGRVVTERDLRELGQQYNLRDDMERMHQSRINVLREKQSKQLDDLTIRQEDEYEKLDRKLRAEAEGLETRFAQEESTFNSTFLKRRRILGKRWTLMEEITRKLLEHNDSVTYGPLPAMEWPDSSSPPGAAGTARSSVNV